MSRHASTGNPYGPVGMSDGPPARFVDHEPFPARRCKCSHVKEHHITDSKGRPLCRSAACGCASYRPEETK